MIPVAFNPFSIIALATQFAIIGGLIWYLIKDGRLGPKTGKSNAKLPKTRVLRVLGEMTNLPDQPRDGDVGIDLIAAADGVIEPQHRVLIPTGVRMEIPSGYFGKIYSRSSMAAAGLDVEAGVIDSAYRGEIKMLIANSNPNTFYFRKGDRLAQMIIQPYLQVNIVKVDSVNETERGSGGFGSTGGHSFVGQTPIGKASTI